MSSCNDIVEIVTDYLEGRMGLADRLRFQLHLGMCTHCRAYVRQMRLIIAALGYLPETSVADELRDDLCKRFARWQHARARTHAEPV